MPIKIVDGSRDCLPQSLRQYGGLFRVLKLGLHNREFVAAEACDQVGLAKAAAEPLRDPRVKENESYATVIVLSRVVTQLGTVPWVTTKTIESLFVSDFSYLQDLYRIINFQDPSILEALEPGAPFPASSVEVG